MPGRDEHAAGGPGGAGAPVGRRVGGATLPAWPLALLGLAGATLALATVLWGFWPGHARTGVYWAVIAVSALVAAAGFVGAKGCFVEVRGDEVRDVVAWLTVHRLDRRRVVEARVARGIWRWFELELDDGRRVTLVGASPLQWPARLAPGASDEVLEELDLLLGPDGRG